MLKYTKAKNSNHSKESSRKSTRNNESIRKSIQNYNPTEVFKEEKIS